MHETRTVNFRTDGTKVKGRRITGYAAVFNEASQWLGFHEVLAPGCFADALRNGDQVLLWQHETSQPLARVSAGSLTLKEDATGLWFSAELPDTTTARDALELVRTGVVKQMSFGFTMPDDGSGEQWDQRNGRPYRTVTRVKELFEVSLVTTPAYTSTTVSQARAAAAARTYSPSPYGPGSRHSWFADMHAVQVAHLMRQDASQHYGAGFSMPHATRLGGTGRGIIPDATEAAARLKAFQLERRDVTTADPGAAGFTPTGAPTFVAKAIAGGIRARSAAAQILPIQPIPEYGDNVTTAKITVGPVANIQATQNTAITETDIDSDTVTTPVGTIAGMVDMSAQALDRAGSGFEMDMFIAGELASAYGVRLDMQVFNGTGTSGQLLGLLNVSGAALVTYTDATPTVQELWMKLLEARSTAGTALGYSPTHVVLHGRRYSWLQNGRDTAGGRFNIDLPGTTWVEANTLPTNLGVGTNEDAILFISAGELPLYVSPLRIEMLPEIGSSTLTVRARIYGYAAMLGNRRPEAIAKIMGTGNTPPVFA